MNKWCVAVLLRAAGGCWAIPLGGPLAEWAAGCYYITALSISIARCFGCTEPGNRNRDRTPKFTYSKTETENRRNRDFGAVIGFLCKCAHAFGSFCLSYLWAPRLLTSHAQCHAIPCKITLLAKIALAKEIEPCP